MSASTSLLRWATGICVATLLVMSGSAQSRTAVAQAVSGSDSKTLEAAMPAPGETVVRRSRSDQSQRYAVFLPDSYDVNEKWPVAFLMDPRRRAHVPLELFRDAANELGFALISSFGTVSDEPTAFEQTEAAFRAMLVDAQTMLSIDVSRMYLVGFSGTAHYALAVAPDLDGHVAGVVAVGGAMPPGSDQFLAAASMERSYAVASVAGRLDFNYDHAREMSRALDDTEINHRFFTFDGTHSWPPATTATEVLEWLQLIAVKQRLADADPTWVRQQLSVYRRRANSALATGDRVAAHESYTRIVDDLAGLPSVGDLKGAADTLRTLTRSRDVKRARKRERQTGERVVAYKLKMVEFVERYRERQIAHERGVKDLRLDQLRQQAADARDPEQAQAAQRMLASAYAHVAFYEPRSYVQRQDFVRAYGVLRLAREIRPLSGRACYWLAQSAAQVGTADDAIAGLKCALSSGGTSATEATADSLLESIRSDPRYRGLLPGQGELER